MAKQTGDNNFIIEFGDKGGDVLIQKFQHLNKMIQTVNKNLNKLNKDTLNYTKSPTSKSAINKELKDQKSANSQKIASQSRKVAYKNLENYQKLTDTVYQSVRAINQQENSIQGVIDKTTRVNSLLSNQDILQKQINAQNDLKLATSKMDLQYKIEHRKELRQQVKEEKKVNDYINGRNPALKTALSTVKKTVAKVISLKVAWVAVKKAFNFILNANKSYGTFIETLNLAEISFQQNAEAVVSWSKDYADSLGLSYNQVLKFASSLKSLADSMGIANDVGAEMSTTLTTLIYNIASLRNLDFDTAYSKVESTIFSGQLRTARTIGVDISVASMQALVRELGYAELEYKNLTEAQKVQLRTIKVLRDLGSQSAGDLEKTLASTSNRLRILESSWENLLTVIGNATNTVFSDLLAYVIGAVQGLSRFIQELQPLTQSTGLNNTASAMGIIEEEIEGVNEQLGLLQIDKFETLAGAGDKKSSLSFDADLDKALSDYNNLNETMQNIDETVKNVSDRFYEMFQSIDKETFKDFANTLGDLVLKLPELVTGFAKFVTVLTNFFLKLYESKALIPYLIGIGLIIAGIKAVFTNWIAGVGLIATGAVVAGISRGSASSVDNPLTAPDLIKNIVGNQTSKANGSASTALQSTQFVSNQPIRVGLDINGREVASALYNDIEYTNQRYTGASLGGN